LWPDVVIEKLARISHHVQAPGNKVTSGVHVWLIPSPVLANQASLDLHSTPSFDDSQPILDVGVRARCGADACTE
jgi:hypothetical protein